MQVVQNHAGIVHSEEISPRSCQKPLCVHCICFSWLQSRHGAVDFSFHVIETFFVILVSIVHIKNDRRFARILFAILEMESFYHRVLRGRIRNYEPAASRIEPELAFVRTIVQRDKTVLDADTRRSATGSDVITVCKQTTLI